MVHVQRGEESREGGRGHTTECLKGEREAAKRRQAVRPMAWPAQPSSAPPVLTPNQQPAFTLLTTAAQSKGQLAAVDRGAFSPAPSPAQHTKPRIELASRIWCWPCNGAHFARLRLQPGTWADRAPQLPMLLVLWKWSGAARALQMRPFPSVPGSALGSLTWCPAPCQQSACAPLVWTLT